MLHGHKWFLNSNYLFDNLCSVFDIYFYQESASYMRSNNMISVFKVESVQGEGVLLGYWLSCKVMSPFNVV